MGQVKGMMMDAQEFIFEYMTEDGELTITLAELLKKAHQEKGMWFQGLVKEEYKAMQEGW